MLQARKANMVYDVTEQEAEAYRARGFDIYDGGLLQAHAVGKTVPVEEYEAVVAELKSLKRKQAAAKRAAAKKAE